jgi:hypothetical protein
VKLDELEAAARSLGGFDPSKLTLIMNGVSEFLNTLVQLLKKNRDDHVATFHDFYLRQQAFGEGRHPSIGLSRFGDVSMSYTLTLSEL